MLSYDHAAGRFTMELFGFDLTAGRESYVPGDVVSGEIILQSSACEVVDDLTICLVGECRVEVKGWFSKQRDSESYLSVKKCLVDHASPESDRKLYSRDLQVKYFEIDVPEGHFPPTFKSPDGDVCIRYDVILRMRLRGKRELVTSRPVRIVEDASASALPEVTFRQSLIGSPVPFMRRAVTPIHVYCESDIATVVYVTATLRRKRALSLNALDQLCLVQRIRYRIGRNKVYEKFHTISCYDDIRLHTNSENEVTVTMAFSRKNLPTIHHCGLISIQYFLQSSSCLRSPLKIPFAS